MRTIEWLTLSAITLSLAVLPVMGSPSERLEVTARLVEIPGTFPPDDLYDYAYVMKYEVVGGELDGQTLLVAHYKPRRQRDRIDDHMKDFVGGNLRRFRVGDVHKMLLDPAVESIWQDALVDEFFATDRESIRYWCLKVDRA